MIPKFSAHLNILFFFISDLPCIAMDHEAKLIKDSHQTPSVNHLPVVYLPYDKQHNDLTETQQYCHISPMNSQQGILENIINNLINNNKFLAVQCHQLNLNEAALKHQLVLTQGMLASKSNVIVLLTEQLEKVSGTNKQLTQENKELKTKLEDPELFFRYMAQQSLDPNKNPPDDDLTPSF